eukprot:1142841-Pelagomonas_calceolata.AAC.6
MATCNQAQAHHHLSWHGALHFVPPARYPDDHLLPQCPGAECGRSGHLLSGMRAAGRGRQQGRSSHQPQLVPQCERAIHVCVHARLAAAPVGWKKMDADARVKSTEGGMVLICVR